jgi:predicted HicB family RNase H-like nuclease
MTMHFWDQFSYRVFWSPEDHEYVGACVEMPGLSWLAKTPEEALLGIRRVTREGVRILEQDGDPVPEPIAARDFSGVFKVRVPPELHRRLVLEATEQNVSLNRLVSAKLAAPALARSLSPAKRSARAATRRHAAKKPSATKAR